MILYIEGPKDYTKLKQLKNNFRKVGGYKVNSQKSEALLFMNYKQK